MRTALVTGATGQTGSYLVEQLLEERWAVHGLTRPGDRAVADVVAGVQLHEGELTDTAGIGRLIDELEPHAVFNLAALSSVAYSWEHPVETAAVNGLAVIGILDAAWALQERLGRPVRVVQASSAELFGDAGVSPQNENTRIAPVNPYGAAKAFAHQSVAVYRGRGLYASSAILYNHESTRRPPTFVTRKITQGAARIARGLQHELVLGNLDAVRDWGWAPDYARALRAIVDGDPDDYVVATGVAHTVRDFVAEAFAAAGIARWEPFVRLDARFLRPADAAALVGDASRLQERLGWAPSIDFGEMVARMTRADLEILGSPEPVA